MEYNEYRLDGVLCRIASFSVGRREAHAVLTVAYPGNARDEISRLSRAATTISEETGMCPAFMRWMLSDATNQASFIPDAVCARSIIQQSPLDGSHAAMLLLLEEEGDFQNIGCGLWKDSRGHLRMGDDDSVLPGDSASMTRYFLETLSETLLANGGTLADNCLRTWFFVRDIDNNYGGLVQARNKVFAAHGLTPDTHFIASTGIAGQSPMPRRLVAFNAFCDLSLLPGQTRYLSALSHLSNTYDYGVAFERATAVDYADRRHVYVSGTASIDARGEIVCPGDIIGQTDRMIENITVLLQEADCDWKDVAHILVYIRDIADYGVVKRLISKRFPNMPAAIVLAPVCRPGWLVETECMAIKAIQRPEYAPY